jgi:hypothetical protein
MWRMQYRAVECRVRLEGRGEPGGAGGSIWPLTSLVTRCGRPTPICEPVERVAPSRLVPALQVVISPLVQWSALPHVDPAQAEHADYHEQPAEP